MKTIFSSLFFILFSISASAESLNPYATIEINYPANTTIATITTDAFVDTCNKHSLLLSMYVGGPGPLNSDMGLSIQSTKMGCLTPADKLENFSVDVPNQGDFVLSYETNIYTNVKVEYK